MEVPGNRDTPIPGPKKKTKFIFENAGRIGEKIKDVLKQNCETKPSEEKCQRHIITILRSEQIPENFHKHISKLLSFLPKNERVEWGEKFDFAVSEANSFKTANDSSSVKDAFGVFLNCVNTLCFEPFGKIITVAGRKLIYANLLAARKIRGPYEDIPVDLVEERLSGAESKLPHQDRTTHDSLDNLQLGHFYGSTGRVTVFADRIHETAKRQHEQITHWLDAVTLHKHPQKVIDAVAQLQAAASHKKFPDMVFRACLVEEIAHAADSQISHMRYITSKKAQANPEFNLVAKARFLLTEDTPLQKILSSKEVPKMHKKDAGMNFTAKALNELSAKLAVAQYTDPRLQIFEWLLTIQIAINTGKLSAYAANAVFAALLFTEQSDGALAFDSFSLKNCDSEENLKNCLAKLYEIFTKDPKSISFMAKRAAEKHFVEREKYPVFGEKDFWEFIEP